MKAQINSQKSVRNQVSKMVLVGLAAIFSLVLTGYSVKALDLKDQFLPSYNYCKMAIYLNEQHSESKIAKSANSANNVEVNTPTKSSTNNVVVDPKVEEIEFALPIKEYNAKEFVDPEMDHEIENWMNSDIQEPNEDAVSESELQIQGYNAKDFTDAEMALEIEKWNTTEKFLNEVEATTAKQADMEIEKYAQKLIFIQNNPSKPSVETTDEEFFKSAEEETAQEAELQIEKYASRQIAQLQNNSGNEIAGNENQK